MTDAGSALMGIGRASGENRAIMAAQQAIESPLIEVSIDGARGVLFSVAGGYDMSMDEIREAAELITASVSPDANIIFGASVRPELDEEIVITVVATGFDSVYYKGGASVPESVAQTAAESSKEAVAVESVDMDLDREAAVEESRSSDFVQPATENMWDSIKVDNDDDVPAILRRRKKD
jgi:cell division protein FtsZ